MFTFLIIVIALVAILLCVIILVQSGKGGGLAASFGGASSSTDSFMGGRQTATVLTKSTWIGGGVFLGLALLLAVMSSRPATAPESILRDGTVGATSAEPPPSLLDAPPITEQSASDSGTGDGSGGS